jgi:hypothetical protein
MNMRDMRGMDGRRLPPRNARGEFRRRRSGSRGDRGMMYHPEHDMRGDYNYDMARQGDMRNDYARQGGYDGHYPQGQGSTYYPIQAMGTFEGYYGMPEQDYARGGRRDYGYDMRYDMRGGDYARGRGRDYGYDYGYDDYGDYGEVLSDEELKEWEHKLLSKLSDQEKQMFSKENIMQRAKAMGKPMEGFGEKELEVVVLMLLDDYKKTLGANPDTMIKLAFDWMNDQDSEVKGSEKLALYHDLVSGELD